VAGLGTVTLSQRAVNILVLTQSVLSGLQYLTAAGVLTDVIGAKLAALVIVVVAATQQGVNTYISRSVGQAVGRVDAVVQRADQVTNQAVAFMAQQGPPSEGRAG
jgi:hypothetical protein